MSPQPRKRPESEELDSETTAAPETSEDTSAESAAAAPTQDDEATTAPAGDPVAEEALEEPASEPVAKKAAAKKKPAAKKKAAAKKQPAAKPAAEEADEAPAKPAPAPRKRDLPREPGEAVVVRAQAKYVRSSARKARLVCDNIRGKTVADAKSILAFHPRNVAEAWEKLLDSAVANAENNHELDVADLKIHAVYADEGPTIKRFRPRAHGRATQIRKRTSHLSIQLTTKD